MTAARRGPARGRAADGSAPALPSPAVEERADVYTRVTEALVAAIEAGAAKGRNWRMPWYRRRGAGAPPALPVNALALWAAAEARGYPAGLWGTSRQWADLGGRVRRGERAAAVVFWRFPDAAAGRCGDPSPAEDEDGGEDGARRGPWARAYAVFNIAQVDGATLPADRAPRLPEEARIAAAERFFAALPGLDLRHGGAAAFYAPATDHVQMPHFADFRAAEGYYGVLGHEATHDAAAWIMPRRKVGAAAEAGCTPGPSA